MGVLKAVQKAQSASSNLSDQEARFLPMVLLRIHFRPRFWSRRSSLSSLYRSKSSRRPDGEATIGKLNLPTRLGVIRGGETVSNTIFKHDLCKLVIAKIDGELLNGELLNGELLNGELLNGELLNGELLNGELPSSGLIILLHGGLLTLAAV
ncbi:hypothetical protein Tco_0674203 [Tanacetum coccineum]